MDIKVKIKNNLWLINWMIPFVKKYRPYGTKRLVLETIKKISGVSLSYNNDNPRKAIQEILSKCEFAFPTENTFFYSIDTKRILLTKGNVISNFTLDYSLIINNGLSQIVKNYIKKNDNYSRSIGETFAYVNMYYDRIVHFVSEREDEKERKDRILSNLEGLMDKPAEHFEQALQRLLFFNQYLWQTRHRLVGLGRLDLILSDLYNKDVQNGYINREEAKKLIVDFYKSLHLYYEFKSSALVGDIGQIIVLGGKSVDGYFYNELTYLFLEVQGLMKYPDPKIVLRISYDTPKDLLRCAIECLKQKTGSPLFSNDDVVIPYLKEFGFEEEDCYNHAFSACWEPYIVGKSFDQNNIKTFDFFNGFSKFLDTTDLKRVKSFDVLFDLYLENLKNDAIGFAKGLDDFFWAEDTFVSLFFEECNRKRLDISKGGAHYNNFGITTVGLGSTCDSLINIRRMVFENCEYDLEYLNLMRNNNYEKDEGLYYYIKNLEKGFGTVDRNALTIANSILDAFNDAICSYKNRFEGKVRFGLSAPNYIMSGLKTKADFAGRKKGDPYNVHISCMTSNYQDLVSFSGGLRYGKCGINGNVVDFFVTPNLLNDFPQKFVSFLYSSLNCGFYQMQMNIMDSKSLQDAKDNPEKYPGLIVRVWGFSAYFNDLPLEYKDFLIERAKKNEIAYY